MEIYHQQLLSPTAYPEPTQTVTFRETHISRVYLTDTRAYKLKKPLNLGFLDFSTLDRRCFFCHEEVRLNRRFSPTTYLGVASLNEENGRVRFDGPGQAIDFAVRMRRLPEELMLAQMIRQNDPSLPERMPELAQTLVSLFARAEPCVDRQNPDCARILENCAENLSQTRIALDHELSPEAHRLMSVLTERDIARLRDLFTRREAQGFVRDGHGDMHTRNICMTKPIQVYDCIEFNRRFRVADIAADLAFLLMDMEFNGRRDLAAALLDAYQQAFEDNDLMSLLPFYKQYRAWVRGKVEAMLAHEQDAAGTTRGKARQLARQYFNLALGYSLRPTLFLTSGLMGTGKTTLALSLAQATGARLLRSDVIRKELAGLSPSTVCHDGYGSGLYSQEMTQNTYEQLFRLCRRELAQGNSVIIDASFANPEQRTRFLKCAEEEQAGRCLLHISCADGVALARLDQRQKDASDGRRELYWRQKQQFAPPENDSSTLPIDSTGDVGYNIQLILCHVLAIQEHLS